MREIERFLCAECAQEMKQAALTCEEQPQAKDKKNSCEWCGRRCYGTVYKIQYGGVSR